MPDNKSMPTRGPWVGIVMGSKSDLKFLQPALDLLAELEIPHEAHAISAHRTPDLAFKYASEAEGRGLHVLIGAAGGAAHLPGVLAAKTVLPVLGVPITSALNGLDSLLSIVQMPRGVPVGTFAIGEAGAVNAALFAAAIVATKEPAVRERLRKWRQRRTDDGVANSEIPLGKTPTA